MHRPLPAVLFLLCCGMPSLPAALGDCGPLGAPCLIGTAGDLDLDGDVDATDWPLWAGCRAGPGVLLEEACYPADLDLDGDADLHDLAVLQLAFTGACNCPPNVLPPSARFSAIPYLGEAPLNVQFDAGRTTDSEAVIDAYDWDFGDGTQATGRAVAHTFATPGSYTVSLTATDAGGLSHHTEVVITVSDGSYDLHAPVSANEARRFLWQAAFGPDPDAVEFIMANGYEAWLDAQAVVPPNRILWEDQEANRLAEYGWNGPQEIWDDICIEGADQLRQRMAWALIQIVVLNLYQANAGERGGGHYYSEYVVRALENYRDLLEYVTFTHQMGTFLTYMGNRKADPVTGIVPDENYARELMQLFTIGLWELNPDGTPMLDELGRPIPTYGNAEVQQFARVFTGLHWNWMLPEGEDVNLHPMLMWPYDHEFGAKYLLNYPGAVPPNGYILAIPPEEGDETLAIEDIQLALDNVFWHPNVGPFIGKQLIQRLVTSNPTPAYVARVATAFEGGGPYGSGVRGDLFATVKAILLDNEARDPAYRSNPAYGRLKEPLVNRWGLYRALARIDRPAERFPLRIGANPWNGMDSFGQQLMQSPSVFNFYPPDYIPPGTALVAPGFFAPELRIHNDVTALAALDTFRYEIIIPDGEAEAARYAEWRLLAEDPVTLVQTLNQELLFGTLRVSARTLIINILNEISDPTFRVRTAVWLIAGSPEFTVLK